MKSSNKQPAIEVLVSPAGEITVEAENAFALCLVEIGEIDPAMIACEKAGTLKSGGLLEIVDRVGQSEANLRGVLETAEAISPYGAKTQPTSEGPLERGVSRAGRSRVSLSGDRRSTAPCPHGGRLAEPPAGGRPTRRSA